MINKCMKILAVISRTQGRNSINLIANSTGIPRSTVHRLLQMMSDNGMIDAQRKGGYIISNTLLRLCLEGTGNMDILTPLIPLVDDIRDQTHETVSVNVINGMERMCIYRAEGDHQITRMVMIGARSPLFKGAAGRILAAGLKKDLFEQALQYSVENGFIDAKDENFYRNRAKRDREQGYAVSIQEKYAGCGSIAVPIKRAINNETIATLSISSLASRIGEQNTQRRYIELLLSAAEEANSRFFM